MGEYSTQDVRVRHFEHTLVSRYSKGYPSPLTFELSDTSFNPVDEKIRPIEAIPIFAFQDRQIATTLSGGEDPESGLLTTIQHPLRLLILCDVREDLLLSTRVGLTRLSESRVDAEAETPPLASRQTIKESTHVTD